MFFFFCIKHFCIASTFHVSTWYKDLYLKCRVIICTNDARCNDPQSLLLPVEPPDTAVLLSLRDSRLAITSNDSIHVFNLLEFLKNQSFELSL